MDDLESRLELAENEFFASDLFRSRGFVENPFGLQIITSGIAWSLGGMLFHELNGYSQSWGDQSLQLRDMTFPGISLTLGSSAYFWGLNQRRLQVKGTNIDSDMLKAGYFPPIAAIPMSIASYFALSSRYGAGLMDFAGAALGAGAIASTLVGSAGEIYEIESKEAPLKTDPLSKRIWHNFWFAYPEAVALAGSAVGTAALPLEHLLQIFETVGVQTTGDNYAMNIAAGLISGVGVYSARAFAGSAVNSAKKWTYYLAGKIAEQTGNMSLALNLQKRRMNLISTEHEAAIDNEKLGSIYAANKDIVKSLQYFEKSARVYKQPYLRLRKKYWKNIKNKQLINNELRIQELTQEPKDVVERAMARELHDRNFQVAEIYSERLSQLSPSSRTAGIYALVLASQRKFDQTTNALAEYVAAIVREGLPFEQAETVGESRHDVWKLDGVVPGYLRRMESRERANLEYENALFFYDSLKGKMPEPVPPVTINGKTYVFSRSFGDMNLLDKIRAGLARPRDMLQTADLLIEMQRIGMQRIENLPDPLRDNDNYLESRYQNTFLRQMRESGIKITAEQEGTLGELVQMLNPHIQILPRAIYRDMNPKNIIDGPAGLKVPIDWEELSVMPLNKDFVKMFMFGAYVMKGKLHSEIEDRVIEQTHPIIGSKISLAVYAGIFGYGNLVGGPLFHMDMAAYAAADSIATKRDDISTWYSDSVMWNLQRSQMWLEILRDIYGEHNQAIGVPISKPLLDQSIQTFDEIVRSNNIGYSGETQFIPDRRRGIFDHKFFDGFKSGYSHT